MHTDCWIKPLSGVPSMETINSDTNTPDAGPKIMEGPVLSWLKRGQEAVA